MPSVLHAFIAETAPETAQAAPSGPMALLGSPFTMLIVMIAIFYFVLWRPQAKERKRLQEWVASIKKGDEVQTQSGIIGTVHSVEDRTILVDVGGGNKIKMLKASVVGPWKPQEPAEPAKAEARK